MNLSGKGDGESKSPHIAAATNTTPLTGTVEYSITDMPNKEFIRNIQYIFETFSRVTQDPHLPSTM